MGSPSTSLPSASPTNGPTESPTSAPTMDPTSSMPTMDPTSSMPTTDPTTSEPTSSPTEAPTDSPTISPTDFPSVDPTTSLPTESPTDMPSESPTTAPTFAPSVSPTTSIPTESPTFSPTQSPTRATKLLIIEMECPSDLANFEEELKVELKKKYPDVEVSGVECGSVKITLMHTGDDVDELDDCANEIASVGLSLPSYGMVGGKTIEKDTDDSDGFPAWGIVLICLAILAAITGFVYFTTSTLKPREKKKNWKVRTRFKYLPVKKRKHLVIVPQRNPLRFQECP